MLNFRENSARKFFSGRLTAITNQRNGKMKTIAVLLFFIAAALAKECLVENKIDDLKFDVDSIIIAPGDSIKWVLSNGHNVVQVNADGVTSFDANACTDPQATCFRSGNPVGADFSVTFPNAGTFFVMCEPHVFTGMKMTVVVDAAAPAECGGGNPPPNNSAFTFVPAVAVLLALLFALF